jgi:hypothetical protein
MNDHRHATTIYSFIVVSLLALTGCTKSDSENNAPRHAAKASVKDDGKPIAFPEGSPGL